MTFQEGFVIGVAIGLGECLARMIIAFFRKKKAKEFIEDEPSFHPRNKRMESNPVSDHEGFDED